jgi:hypothetical protein
MDRSAGIDTTSWAVASGATRWHGTRRERGAGRENAGGREPHQSMVGSRTESVPPSTWTESGRTPVLPEWFSILLDAAWREHASEGGFQQAMLFGWQSGQEPGCHLEHEVLRRRNGGPDHPAVMKRRHDEPVAASGD